MYYLFIQFFLLEKPEIAWEESIYKYNWPLLIFLAGSLVIAGVLPFSNSDGMVSVLRGGVRDIGEFRKFIKKARSYTMRVPTQNSKI